MPRMNCNSSLSNVTVPVKLDTKVSTGQGQIGCLVSKLVAGNKSKDLMHCIDSWSTQCGVEWTCNRIKAYWNAALCLKNQDRDSARKIYQSHSIAYNRATMYPKDAWGWVVRSFVESRNLATQKRFAALLRFYTSLVLTEPSKAQIAKLSSITSPNRTNKSVIESLFSEGEQVLKSRGCNRIDYTHTRRPNAKRLHSTSNYFSSVKAELNDILGDVNLLRVQQVYTNLRKKTGKIRNELMKAPYGNFCFSLLSDPWIPESLQGSVPGLTFRQGEEDYVRQNYVGEVVMLQQQGCKARTVFTPSAAVQLAFEPLHSKLQYFADTFFAKESCYDDQVYAAHQIHEFMNKGGKVYCLDQSSATDRFPRQFSELMMDYLGLHRYSEALEEVCNQPWHCSYVDSKTIYIGPGQPMGLYGSFPLYHLSNCLCAAIAENRVKQVSNHLDTFPDGTTFKVVGDDIAISDGRVALQYRNILDSLNVSISETKSYCGKVGEFAGFIFLPGTDEKTNVFRPYKVPEKDFISNPIDFLNAIGAHVNCKHLSKKWSRYYKAWSKSLAGRDIDLSPIPIWYSKEELAQKDREENVQRTVSYYPSIMSTTMQCVNILRYTQYIDFNNVRVDMRDILPTCTAFVEATQPCYSAYPNGYFANYGVAEYFADIFRLEEDEWKTYVDYPMDRHDEVVADKQRRRNSHHLDDKRIYSDPLMSSALDDIIKQASHDSVDISNVTPDKLTIHRGDSR